MHLRCTLRFQLYVLILSDAPQRPTLPEDGEIFQINRGNGVGEGGIEVNHTSHSVR